VRLHSRKSLQTREALKDTLNNMKSILKKNSKNQCEAFNVGDVLVPKVESSSLKIGILLA
jgi:hypothetical protein